MLAAGAQTPGPAIQISPDVKAIIAEYGNGFGPAAESELRSLSAIGDRSASALLGELLMMPDRIGGPDLAGSCDYSEKAGQVVSALHNLATCYFQGTGRPKDIVKARDLYRQAAELDYPRSKCAFGNMLVHEQGGPADPVRGIELCRQGAEAGDPDAQTDYAGYLLTGKYAPKDAVTARQYLSKAAEKGHRNAAFLLGQIYWYGDGIERNVPQAAIWWIKAYERGRKDAAFWIGGAAASLVVDAAKSKQPVATTAIAQARKWLGIAALEDPDSKKRTSAREMQESLELLLAKAEPAP